MGFGTRSIDATPLDVTVVLPVHDEAGHLLDEVDRITGSLAASPFAWELIVVDDGSTDGSADLLAGRTVPEETAPASGQVRLIRLPENRGSGTARRIGTKAARGRVVVWTDADMTYPNDRIPELVKELEGYDQVVGARTSEQGTAKALRVPAKWTIRKLASFLVERPIPDLNSGFRAFRRSVALPYLHLLPAGFSCVTTITMAFLANGHTVKYVPIEYRERAGRSKFHWWRDTRNYLLQVIRLVLSYNPLRVFLPVGLTLLVGAFAKLGYDLVTKDLRVGTNTLVLVFAGFQVLMTGLLADLVVRATRPRVTDE